MVDKNIPVSSNVNDHQQHYEEEVQPEPETRKRPEMFLPKPEKIRKKEKPVVKQVEAELPVEQGPPQRANPYGEWKTIAPK
jgi:hypothetical protein